MFFTEVKPAKIEPQLTHGEKIWTIGSCFSDEIGRRLASDLFNIRINPCGTLYNPASIARALNRIIDGTPYCEADVFEHNGMWHCMDFHSAFSKASPGELLDSLNRLTAALHSEITSIDRLMVTFGSARMFIDRATGAVAGNCHKLPSARFEVKDIDAEEITGMYVSLTARLKQINPHLEMVMTVSPIRHKAYGYHADKLSKSTLLLAEDRICRATGAAYFPSYEIMDDELRDYRFYASDMIHPSEVACDHIYSKFLHAACGPATISLAEECRKLSLRLAHRCTSNDKAGYEHFMAETYRLAQEMAQRHPELADVIGAAIHNQNNTEQNQL